MNITEQEKAEMQKELSHRFAIFHTSNAIGLLNTQIEAIEKWSSMSRYFQKKIQVLQGELLSQRNLLVSKVVEN